MTEDNEVLLRWTQSLARANTVLKEPVRYHETPLRPVTVTNVGRTARSCLRGIMMARAWRGKLLYHYDEKTDTGRNVLWHTDEYWDRIETESLRELAVMRDAVIAAAVPHRVEAPETSKRPTALQGTML